MLDIQDNDSPNWVGEVLGKPFEIGGRGPDSFDCWGVLKWVYKLRGIEIPDLQTPKDLACQALCFEGRKMLPQWQPCSPFDGCAVALSQMATVHHVGVYCELDQGWVIHAHKPRGMVVATPVSYLPLEGWNIRGFYDHPMAQKSA